MEPRVSNACLPQEAIARDRTAQPLLEHLWGIVLAGGEGRRLQDFIRAYFDTERPKQYCALINHRSMFRHTILRAERLIPPERLVSIITHAHLPYAQEELHDRPPQTVIVQPCNRDTGPGILLPLLHIQQWDPDAIVVLFPSDHFIPEEARFMASVEQAVAFVSEYPAYPVLLGVEPTRPEVEYGWIEPGDILGHVQGDAVYRMQRFWEKPSLDQATGLYLKGYLWNTMVLVARAAVLLKRLRRLTPALVEAFEPIRRALGSPLETDALQAVYTKLHAVNFSRAVLARCPQRLGVLRVQGVYWSDWGDPVRILQDCARFMLRQSLQNEADYILANSSPGKSASL